ncbi:hypothetical protein KFL_000510060 [Klebsormidium nitens]|uniref:Uncharacterized protein n=1 Tax=Klebsormidium nitens TaxID=105231 RepID=A0A1Y1HUU5_KLENI|nr:hypothetical protein KFL_000510060 [Klebsormidium nitens]|eukprot:GAQ80306.1 hypothetical protein KFL_000510060 [Klebsormidium nitens]
MDASVRGSPKAEDYRVPDCVLQLIQERPHGGKVRPKYVPPEPSGWSVVDTSRLVSVLQAAPSERDAATALLDLASVSGPEPLGERSEWARAAARRTIVAGGLGNGAVSGWQVKQHRQHTVIRQKVKAAATEARLQSSGDPSIAPPQPPASKVFVANFVGKQPPLSSGFGLSMARSFDWIPTEEEGPLEVEGSELVTSPDVMIPIKPAKPKRRGAQGQKGGGDCQRSRSPQQKRTSSEVVVVPWSITAQQGRIETIANDKPRKCWV